MAFLISFNIPQNSKIHSCWPHTAYTKPHQLLASFIAHFTFVYRHELNQTEGGSPTEANPDHRSKGRQGGVRQETANERSQKSASIGSGE